jgi:hypothetical protein
MNEYREETKRRKCTQPTIHTVITQWRMNSKKSEQRFGSGDIIKGTEKKIRQTGIQGRHNVPE